MSISDLADEMLKFPFGNVAVFNGRGECDKTLLIATHTDKPYLVCTSINGNGTAKASLIGETSAKSSAFSYAVSDKGVSAAVTASGSDDEPCFELDFGAGDKEEAEGIVSVGDVFRAEGSVKRFAGCTVSAPYLSVSAPTASLMRLCELLRENPPSCKVYVAFIKEGQFALGGYAPAASTLNVTHAVCVGAVDSSSATGVKLGCGASVRLSDRSFGSDKPLSDSLIKEGAVPAVLTKGACAAAKTQGIGVPSAQLDIPVKYINTHTEIVDVNDVSGAADILLSICI